MTGTKKDLLWFALLSQDKSHHQAHPNIYPGKYVGANNSWCDSIELCRAFCLCSLNQCFFQDLCLVDSKLRTEYFAKSNHADSQYFNFFTSHFSPSNLLCTLFWHSFLTYSWRKKQELQSVKLTEVQAISQVIKKTTTEMLGWEHLLQRNQFSLKNLSANGWTDFTFKSWILPIPVKYPN